MAKGQRAGRALISKLPSASSVRINSTIPASPTQYPPLLLLSCPRILRFFLISNATDRTASPLSWAGPRQVADNFAPLSNRRPPLGFAIIPCHSTARANCLSLYRTSRRLTSYCFLLLSLPPSSVKGVSSLVPQACLFSLFFPNRRRSDYRGAEWNV